MSTQQGTQILLGRATKCRTLIQSPQPGHYTHGGDIVRRAHLYLCVAAAPILRTPDVQGDRRHCVHYINGAKQ
jgi:hypothetical protein